MKTISILRSEEHDPEYQNPLPTNGEQPHEPNGCAHGWARLFAVVVFLVASFVGFSVASFKTFAAETADATLTLSTFAFVAPTFETSARAATEITVFTFTRVTDTDTALANRRPTLTMAARGQFTTEGPGYFAFACTVPTESTFALSDFSTSSFATQAA